MNCGNAEHWGVCTTYLQLPIITWVFHIMWVSHCQTWEIRCATSIRCTFLELREKEWAHGTQKQLTGFLSNLTYFFSSFECKICKGVYNQIKNRINGDSIVQVSHSISEIQAGRTPNPDILCNSRIKFGELLDIWCISTTKTSNWYCDSVQFALRESGLIYGKTFVADSFLASKFYHFTSRDQGLNCHFVIIWQKTRMPSNCLGNASTSHIILVIINKLKVLCLLMMALKVSYSALTQGPAIWCICVSGAFLEHIKEAEFDRVASGHYARVRRILTNDGNGNERTELLLSADQVCDNLSALQFLISSHLRGILMHGLISILNLF